MTAETRASDPPLSWLTHVPVPLFAVVMGLAGLGLAWRKSHEALGWPAIVGEAVLALAGLAFAAITVLYAAKLLRHTGAVIREFNHPIRVNFFPAFSISLLLMASAALPYGAGLAEGLWLAGTGLQLVFALAIINRWITHNVEIQHASPAWFIPVVGNILVPIAGARLGYVEVSWFFFSVGLLFWVVLFAIVLYRIIFHDQLPATFLPTLFILMAPPAIGMVAYLQLNGGGLDTMARVLFAVALFIALLLATMARLFLRVPFAVSWWAFTFPSAAMTIAAVLYYERVPGPATAALGIALLLATTAIITVVTARTLAALARGRLFVPE